MTLKPDGSLECKGWDFVVRWEVIDRRTVVFFIEKGRDTNRVAVLMFAEDLSEFRGFDFHGPKLPVSKRKP
jgi:hypothetical protein